MHPDLIDALMAFGGFPEAFLAQSARALRCWHKARLERLYHMIRVRPFGRPGVRVLPASRFLAALV